MSEVLKHLKKKEWSMGNGQCPECYGVPESWHGHLLYKTSENIGHEKDCIMAEMLILMGQKPLMMGEYKSEIVYESYIHGSGALGTRPKTKDGCPKLKAFYQKGIKDSLVEALKEL